MSTVQRTAFGASMAQSRDIYRYLLKKHGPYSTHALGWPGQPVQEAHFKTLTREVRSNSKLIDFGCGVGDLYGFLQRVGLRIRYEGFDMVPDMVEAARQKHPEAHFEVRDSLQGLPDKSRNYIVASGTFGLRLVNHLKYVEDSLAQFARVTTDGFAVNFINLEDDLRIPNDFFAIDQRGLESVLHRFNFKFKIEASAFLQHLFAFVDLR